jgi:hypothetical protein
LVGGILGLVVSLILFMGLSLVNFLSADEAASYIGKGGVDFVKGWKLPLYGAVGLLFLLQQVWLRWPKPASLGDVQELRATIEPLLRGVLVDYYKIIASKGANPASVRINIMLPTWRRFRLGRYLKIYYSDGGPAGSVYPGDELDLMWTRRWPGACGTAWLKKQRVIYDSATDNLKAPERKLSGVQKRVVGNIKSVLSLPIWSKEYEEVLGVLNLDSTWNIDRTLFDQREIVALAESWAGVFSRMVFRYGVNGG